MAKSLKMKEIFNFDKAGVAKKILDLKEEMHNMKFKIAANDLKDIRQVRAIKKSIARLSTYLTSK